MNVVLFREGGNSSKDQLLDGISRLDAMEANGVNLVDHCGKFDRTLGYPGFRVRVVANVDPVAMVDSLNLHRRHLTQEQKRERIEDLLKATPERSNNATAKLAKVSDKTVTKVRKELEGRSEIPNVSKRTDTKGRAQPARKPASNKPSKDAAEAAVIEREAAALAKQDVGPYSAGEVEQLRVQVDELGAAKRLLEIQIEGYANEIAELKAENADLRQQLEVFKSPVRCEFVEDDGGRVAAGYGEPEGDCVARAITIATGKPYAEVFEELKARHARYVKRLRPVAAGIERRRRTEPIHNGCEEKVSSPYLKSLGWEYTRLKERVYLRAGALPSGRLIVNVNHHFTALIDGIIHDTFDSGGTGKRPVLGYWSQGGKLN